MQSLNRTIPHLWRMTFHFVNGESQTFDIHPIIASEITAQDIRQEIRRFLKEDWWAIKTPERTVFVNPANVLSVEINPAIESLEGEGILHSGVATEITS